MASTSPSQIKITTHVGRYFNLICDWKDSNPRMEHLGAKIADGNLRETFRWQLACQS